jgi:hypothetical protein
MSRQIVQRAVAFLAAAALFALAAAARQPGLREDPAGGKFALPGGGYAVVSVDEFGRVEGYSERAGAFSRLSGRYADGVASGYWVARRGQAVCATEREGSRSWGRFRLIWDAAGKPRTAWSDCEAAPPVE